MSLKQLFLYRSSDLIIHYEEGAVENFKILDNRGMINLNAPKNVLYTKFLTWDLKFACDKKYTNEIKWL